ncbi:hypothetical protein DSO57_1017081 [Entomophthora muscae]|uniref:Uncharacterized protein n=1 Tax=Entomophthora muscae TaxID=34485 RepID=A0ACC2STP4_9FUNG|nr:hypothetical protein DSO57_1017081 [Entomophthora muscae]
MGELRSQHRRWSIHVSLVKLSIIDSHPSGDTGYCQVFKEIGRRYGPFRLATLPIGSYQPRSLTQSFHVSPDEALAIHKDLRSQLSFGIHWGTFIVSDEHYLDPQRRLTEMRGDQNFLTSRLGETRCMPLAYSATPSFDIVTDTVKYDMSPSLSSSAILLSEAQSELEEESGSEGYYTIN